MMFFKNGKDVLIKFINASFYKIILVEKFTVNIEKIITCSVINSAIYNQWK